MNIYKYNRITKIIRCTRTIDLVIHHKRRDGGNGVNNAEVLCRKCHKGTKTFDSQGSSPHPFSSDNKILALMKAGYQCECIKTCGCH